MDLSIEHKDAGFFLKPLFGSHQPWGPSVTESLFVVTHPKGTVRVKAAYGPFAAEEVVTPTILQAALGNQSLLLNNVVVDDMDVSAHLVTRSITQERPVLQVLFHATHPQASSASSSSSSSSSSSTGSRGKNKEGKNKDNNNNNNNNNNRPDSWCLQMHVVKTEEEYTAVCEVNYAKDVCVTELGLPVEWWDPLHIQSADVYYSVYRTDASLECAGVPKTLGGGVGGGSASLDTDGRIRSYIGPVTLTSGQLTYAEMKEDQHVLVYIPQKTFYPGSTFRVPVRLQAESDLTLFVVR